MYFFSEGGRSKKKTTATTRKLLLSTFSSMLEEAHKAKWTFFSHDKLFFVQQVILRVLRAVGGCINGRGYSPGSLSSSGGGRTGSSIMWSGEGDPGEGSGSAAKGSSSP